MRTVYDGTGADVTSFAFSYMKSKRSLMLADLFWIQTNVFWGNQTGDDPAYNFFMTNGSFPIKVGTLQTAPDVLVALGATYTPSKDPIVRGDFNYKVGLEADSVDVTWYLKNTTLLPNQGLVPPPSIKNAFAWGYFTDALMYIHRAIWDPSTGLVGTMLMWRGPIRSATIDREKVVMKVTSPMDLFQDVQVPTQLVQPNSRTMPYITPFPTYQPSGPQVGSTSTDLIFTTAAVADHALRDGYMMAAGTLIATAPKNNLPPQIMYRIRDNVTLGGTNLHIFPYEPVAPEMVMGVGINIWLQRAQTAGAPGFGSVPPPEMSI